MRVKLYRPGFCLIFCFSIPLLLQGCSASKTATANPAAPDAFPITVTKAVSKTVPLEIQAVGNVDLLLIAIDNGKDRMVFAGPVLSHYEFELTGIVRKSDSEWGKDLNAGRLPPRPEWTQGSQRAAFRNSS